MKITQDVRTQLEGTKQQAQVNTRGKQSFDSMVQSQSRQLQEAQLNQLMKSISAQGEKVARFRSFRDLAKYKRLIKDFLEESVKYGLNVKQTHSFDLDGRSRKLTIVEAVDERLAELTEAVMDQEKQSIDLLGIIGEIKGLLINLYT
ncbi:YaaR family protein [Halobacillus sp. A1]|uniref:YaaR family protein n=1 Tax=Halobacillus campisalis TaxID=435909 RepID=A0ABW2K7P6_9BACI|nr:MULTISPECIES: YaaR family protein [Halobacillus]MCP3033574.1 YaaR family protein [Halobacillus sp. A1]